jgi:dTDP-glucose pyrophosphorylase
MIENLKKVLTPPHVTIKQALKQMDAMGEKTMIVVDEHQKILATVTDGDIRRWVLKGKSINAKLSNVMNRSPLTLPKDFVKDDARQLMLKCQIECLPVIDENRKVIAYLGWTDLFENRLKIFKPINHPVVIMAGGEGVRLHPFTKILPKSLMPIGDKPIMEMILNRFFDHGCHDFYLSLNYKSNIIKAYFSEIEHPFKIKYILEKKPLGTAGSLYLLRKRIKKIFFVSNCDVLIEADYADIIKFHQERKNIITLVCAMKNYTIPYGVCTIDNDGGLRDIHEKPEHHFLVNTGMYVMDPSIFDYLPKGHFYNMTDLINDVLRQNGNIGVYPVSEKAWLDIGQFEALHETLKKFELKENP